MRACEKFPPRSASPPVSKGKGRPAWKGREEGPPLESSQVKVSLGNRSTNSGVSNANTTGPAEGAFPEYPGPSTGCPWPGERPQVCTAPSAIPGPVCTMAGAVEWAWQQAKETKTYKHLLWAAGHRAGPLPL